MKGITLRTCITGIVLWCVHTPIHAPYIGCDVSLSPLWQDLEGSPERAQTFGGKLMLVGAITFKKRMPEHIKLQKLSLRWQGPNNEQLPDLACSLYQKDLNKEFLPIQEFLVCDGMWNATKQLIDFTFDQTKTLSTYDIFYVVITVPELHEDTIKKGSFVLLDSSLPEIIKESIHNKPLILSFETMVPKENSVPVATMKEHKNTKVVIR